MWIRSYNKTFADVKREDVWKIWVDVNNWQKSAPDLEYCKMDGSFAVNNHIILKPQNGPEMDLTITEVAHGYKFTTCHTFFGAKMSVAHELEEVTNGLKIRYTITLKGLLKWIWVRRCVQNFADSAPSKIETLVNLARGKSV